MLVLFGGSENVKIIQDGGSKIENKTQILRHMTLSVHVTNLIGDTYE